MHARNTLGACMHARNVVGACTHACMHKTPSIQTTLCTHACNIMHARTQAARMHACTCVCLLDGSGLLLSFGSESSCGIIARRPVSLATLRNLFLRASAALHAFALTPKRRQNASSAERLEETADSQPANTRRLLTKSD